MAAPDFKKFENDPKSLLVWLKTNLLMAGPLKNVTDKDGLAWVSITPSLALHEKLPTPSATDHDENDIKVFKLTSNGTGNTDAVRAFVCNYQAKEATSVKLSNSAKFCFTTNMNGCTLGISVGEDGSTLVTHANSGGNTTKQRTQIKAAHGDTLKGVKLLEPSMYRTLTRVQSLQATVIGLRIGSNWDFYFQSYSSLGSKKFKINGVIKL